MAETRDDLNISALSESECAVILAGIVLSQGDEDDDPISRGSDLLRDQIDGWDELTADERRLNMLRLAVAYCVEDD